MKILRCKANSDKDCNGDCSGSAYYDDCGVCSGGETDHLESIDKDCDGACFGRSHAVLICLTVTTN